MNLEFTQEELEFQQSIRDWMQANVPDDIKRCSAVGEMTGKELQQKWERLLGERGWLALTWPKQYGGPGWTATQRYIFDLERAMAGAPPTSPFGVAMVGPVLYTFGSQEQKDRWLPGIVSGRTLWCQGYSEPNAGSDLASLKTRAERRDDHYLVNGQKIWNSGAQFAEYGILVTRSDPNVPKHKGLTYFYLDMKSPGVEVRPIKQMQGFSNFNEVFLTDVRIPDEQRLGAVGDGWKVAITTLMNERVVSGVRPPPPTTHLMLETSCWARSGCARMALSMTGANQAPVSRSVSIARTRRATKGSAVTTARAAAA